MGYFTGMLIDAGLRFSVNFGHEEFYWEISCTLLVPVLGYPCSQEKIFKNSSHSKFSRTENSREMLDQYYENNCCQ